MKIFLDANILVTVLNKEYPLFPSAAKLLSLSERKHFQLYTSPICLAIAFYFAEKKFGTKLAKNKITLLSENMEIASCGKKETLMAASDPRVMDYEDGLEYFSALHAHCSCIITENTEDFYFSEIEIIKTEAFLGKYAVRM
jgi:predicted nucleic acid-binding protein